MSKAKANISEQATSILRTKIFDSDISILIAKYVELKNKGWQVFAVDQQRGRCYYSDKVITVPVWALQSDKKGYWIYYLSHEIAHAYCGYGAGHGLQFQEKLKEICPEEYLHYELDYKPAFAAAAGISRKEIELQQNQISFNPGDYL
jgi:hypothetical protein